MHPFPGHSDVDPLNRVAPRDVLVLDDEVVAIRRLHDLRDHTYMTSAKSFAFLPAAQPAGLWIAHVTTDPTAAFGYLEDICLTRGHALGDTNSVIQC